MARPGPAFVTAKRGRTGRTAHAPLQNSPMPSALVRDLRHAVRLLAAAPAFTAVAVLTLGLAVGANTAIFSVTRALLLQPLPYPEPDRLLFVDGVLARPDGDAGFQLSYPDVQDIAAQSATIDAAAPWSDNWGLALEGTDGAARLEANLVGRDYFGVLGGVPSRGRVFAADEHVIGGDRPLVVVLSDAAWRQQFGADPDIVGRVVRLQRQPVTVIGVMPPSFHDVAVSRGARIDVWAPLEQGPALVGPIDFTARPSRVLWVVARLAPEASVAEARAELATLGAAAAAAHPATNTRFSYRAAPLAASFFADARRPLWLLLAGSLFVLLIGCVNVANLLLVRATTRAREIAVRLAIGASRRHVVQQLLVESAVLALAGGAAGVMLAFWVTPALVRVSGIAIPAFTRVEVDGMVLGVALATSLACGLGVGLAPVLRAIRIGGHHAIAAGGAGRVSGSARTARLLAGVQVTAAFVLAAAALMMLQSFAALAGTDLAFQAERLLTVRLELPADRYATPAVRAQAGQQLLDRLRGLPGVEDALIWGPSMFARSTWVAFVDAADRPARDEERLMLWRHSTNPGGLATLGVPVVAGRDLAATDTLQTPTVAVISQAAAARLWPGQDPVGRQVRSGSGTTASTITIVGVAADARHRGRFRFSLGAAAYEPQLDLYLAYAQRPNGLVTLGVRTHGAAEAQTAAVRAAIAAIDPAVPVFDVETLEQRMREEESPVAFAALLLNIYGGLALALAGVGVYGVLAAGVAARRRELGIRAALGAEPARLLKSVVFEGLALSLAAIVVGAAVSAALARMFSGLVFGAAAGDGRPLVLASVVLIALAVIASAVPARWASRVDPLEALRDQ
jgi:putative ABC transport system permease protein